jgi:plastocyanin
MSGPRSILLAALVGVAACSGDSGNGDQSPSPEGDVLVENNDFEPGTVQATPGATVVWAWSSGGTTHNVTFDDGEESGDKSSGTYQRTFATVGSFPYHCTIHGTATSGMRGVVTVSASPPPGGGGNGGGGGGGGGGY